MIDIPSKYEAVFFGNIEDIKPATDTITVLIEMFKDKNMLPSTFRTYTPKRPITPMRLRLSAPDKEWVIDFSLDRISIQKNIVKPRGANMGTTEDFVKEAIARMKRILQKYPRKANRLALITEGLMKEMSEDQLNGIFERLFRAIEFYKENVPNEWGYRSVSKVEMPIKGKEDAVNAITTIKRIKGEYEEPERVVPMDRILIGSDINTFHENVEPRFEIESINDFFAKALELRGKILDQVEDAINGQ